MPVDGPELPDGGAEGGILGLGEQGPRRTQEVVLRGPEAVEEHGGADPYEHPPKRPRSYTGGGDEHRPRDALGVPGPWS